MTVAMTAGRSAAPGLRRLREAPDGLPDPNIQPPVIAEASDPFTALRVIDLVARIERGTPVRIADLVSHLNATYLDWMFERSVVEDALLQLQANWMSDYRNVSGILVEDGTYGPALTIEDSSRVDPWIVRQAERQAAACRARLVDFARRERMASEE
jgi:hypothetical protein